MAVYVLPPTSSTLLPAHTHKMTSCHQNWYGNQNETKLMTLYFTSQISSCSKCTWAATWQNQHCGCAPSEDSDQPGHPPSLIRVVAVRMKKAWVLSYPLSTQQRLWSDWVDAQADLSLRWAHTHFIGFVMSWLTHTWYLYPYILEIARYIWLTLDKISLSEILIFSFLNISLLEFQIFLHQNSKIYLV